MREEAIIEARGIGKVHRGRSGSVTALDDFSVTVRAGEIFGLLGPNGAGKTTLVKIIMGFVRPSTGGIFHRGVRLLPARPRPGFGCLPELYRPHPCLTVSEIIRFHAALAGGRAPDRQRIAGLLRQVGMDGFADRRAGDLSKGMGQRVALAVALSGDPDVLILDEPGTGLDPLGRSDMAAILEEQRSQGRTILLCSHHLPDVERLCDRIAVLVAGRGRFVGTPGEFVASRGADSLEAAFLTEARCAARSC